MKKCVIYNNICSTVIKFENTANAKDNINHINKDTVWCTTVMGGPPSQQINIAYLESSEPGSPYPRLRRGV